MKIGLSYSRCVRDIVDGVVDINDVLVVISRTDFDPHVDEEWTSLWRGYRERSGWSRPEWIGYPEEAESKFREVSIQLWEQGKFHQPRKFGSHPIRRPEIWLEAVLVDGDLDSNPAAKIAFEKFKTLASLSSIDLNNEYQ